MRILIAEDDVISARVLRAALEKLGHEVVTATNGGDAWRMIQDTPFPLVISDWMMPEMDGPELFGRIRALKRCPYPYLVLLTARTTREDRLKGLQAGADDLLTKPLDTHELAVRLQIAERILSMQEELRQQSRQLEAAQSALEQQNASLSEAMTFLEAASHRFSELFQGLPIACFTYDAEGRIYEWNRACEKLYGLRAGQVMERTVQDIFCSSECAQPLQDIVSRVFAGERFEGLEWQQRRADGTTLHLLYNTFPLHSPNGAITGAISASIDITERKRAEQQIAEQLLQIQQHRAELEIQKAKLEAANAQLEALAITDGLTGLKNHRHFREMLDRSFTHTLRYRTPLSLVLLDVDHFKQYNDSFGHPAGDEVLRTVAYLLRNSARTADLAARYGGEEFVLLLPETDYAGSLQSAERLRCLIASQSWPLRAVTASFGVTTFSPALTKASEMIDEADRALYHSKTQGRNRVTHYHDMQEAAIPSLPRAS